MAIKGAPLICGALALLYAFWIARGLVTPVQGHLWPVIFDDALISMRYARNLVTGYPWVWNPGDPPLEGFTNLGWVLWLALGQHFFPDRVSLAWAVLFQGVILHGILTVATSSLAGRLGGAWAAWAAGFAMAFLYPMAFWALSGLEVPVMALLTLGGSATVLGATGALGKPAPLALSSLRLFVVVLALMLVRNDGLIPALGFAVALACSPHRVRLFPVLGAAVLAMVIAGVGTTAFRLSTFGSPVPNTYYLKMEGFPTLLRVLRGFVQTMWQVVLGVMVPMLLLWVWSRRTVSARHLLAHITLPRRRAALVFIPLLGVAYSVYVGGDAWEGALALNRFVATVWPLLVVLVVITAGKVGRKHGRAGSACLAMGVTLAFTASILPTRNWVVALGQWTGLVRPLGVDLHGELLNLVPVLERTVPPSATVAVAHAGTLPYYVDRRFIDLLGKCDAVVARRPMHRYFMTRNPLLEFFPGHLKWDYGYSIGQLQPDFIVTHWGRTLPDAEPHLRGQYQRISEEGRVEIWKRIK